MVERDPQASGFFAELQRRQVLRVLGFYAIAVWLIWQIGDVVLEPLQAPSWVMPVLVVSLAVGFPIVAVLAWVYDITPRGLVRTDSEDSTLEPAYVDVIVSRPRLWVEVAIITVLLFAVVFLVARLFNAGPVSQPIRAASVAVLPFTNMSPDPDDAYLGDALAEDIIHQLVQIAGLQVAARTSSWSYRDHADDIPHIARALRVDSVLEGSVQRDGEQLKVTLQLINGSNGFHQWSRSFVRPFSEIFKIREEVALLTARALGVVVSDASAAELERPPTRSIEAYELYLRGLEYHQRPHSGTVLDTALSLFTRAIEIDPRFGNAYSALCHASLYKFSATREVADFEAGERACHRAFTLAPNTPETHVSLGHLYQRSGQYEHAEDQYRTALRIKESADAMLGLAWVFAYTRRHAEAKVQFEAAVAQFPGYWLGHHQYGKYLYMQDDYAGAIKRFEWEVELVPDSPSAYQSLSAAQFLAGDIDAAETNLERAISMRRDANSLATLGLYRWYQNDRAGAMVAFEDAAELTPEDYRLWCHIASVSDSPEAAYATAARLLAREMAVNVNDAETHAAAAVCHARANRANEARSHLETALSLGPDTAGVHYAAAKVLLILQETARAREHLATASELGYSRVIIDRDPELRTLLEGEG